MFLQHSYHHHATVKHSGDSIIVWGCFAVSGSGTVVVQSRWNNKDYLQNDQLHLKSTARRLKLGHNWMFQQDNDAKHTSKLVLEQIKQVNINFLEWPSQSTDLNPTVNLWTKLKSQVCARKSANLNKLYQFCLKEWSDIHNDYMLTSDHNCSLLDNIYV